MKSVKVYHYDAFSREPNQGNPAGVVLAGDELTDEEMQAVALKVGFNETAFVVRSSAADLRIRYFTPGHEMNLCGHGTMATIYALKSKGLLQHEQAVTIETRAGILPIQVDTGTEGDIEITMKQAEPQFERFDGSYVELAHSIGLHPEDIDPHLPIVYGSTGTWTLLIPIKSLSAFERMSPRNDLFPAILQENPKASVHPFCLETNDQTANMHARHFSSPYSGTIEDPVTGTASGVMGAYYAEYIDNQSATEHNLIVEQGHEIGKNGRVRVKVVKAKDSYDVSITGSAVFVRDFEVVI